MRMSESVLEELRLAYEKRYGKKSPPVNSAKVKDDIRDAFGQQGDDAELRSAYWRGLIEVRFDDKVKYEVKAPENFEPALKEHEQAVKKLITFQENPYIILGSP